MPSWFHRYQPIQLYIVLLLSICYFTVQLVLSHVTHGLTLLMASYHMLCNIFALAGCIITIKHSHKREAGKTTSQLESKPPWTNSSSVICLDNKTLPKVAKWDARSERREMKLRNTFGWTRVDILTMLIVCIILASLSFSLLVEALQTLVHIDHQDTMHLPVPMMILGFMGIVLNGLTYLLIGGYTMHQGSFLHVTPTGQVVLDRVMSSNEDVALKPVERQLSRAKNDQQLKEDLQAEGGRVYAAPKRQGALELFRDLSSTLFVIVCALIVYVARDFEQMTKLIDPLLAIVSCVLLVILSYPYMKESCLILLQTIPGSLDINNFERNLTTQFPDIVSYHDLHIWQLSAHRNVATIHIQFRNSKLYHKIIDDVKRYFEENGINHVTIQPEFDNNSTGSLECLMQCTKDDCIEKVCCKDSRTDLREVSVDPQGEATQHENGHGHAHGHKKKANSHAHGHSHQHKHGEDAKSKALRIATFLGFKKSSCESIENVKNSKQDLEIAEQSNAEQTIITNDNAKQSQEISNSSTKETKAEMESQHSHNQADSQTDSQSAAENTESLKVPAVVKQDEKKMEASADIPAENSPQEPTNVSNPESNIDAVELRIEED